MNRTYVESYYAICIEGDITIESSEGLGMKLIRARVTKLNGTFEMYSKIGEGTTIRVTVPVKEKKAVMAKS